MHIHTHKTHIHNPIKKKLFLADEDPAKFYFSPYFLTCLKLSTIKIFKLYDRTIDTNSFRKEGRAVSFFFSQVETGKKKLFHVLWAETRIVLLKDRIF